MKLSANEAAKRTGKSVPTITRAIKSGKISAEKNGKGGYLIEPSELFRAFPAITEPNDETPQTLYYETHKSYPHETLSLQERVSSLEAALADAKAERDEWRDQAKRLAMALPAPETVASEKAENKKGFWKRLFG